MGVKHLSIFMHILIHILDTFLGVKCNCVVAPSKYFDMEEPVGRFLLWCKM